MKRFIFIFVTFIVTMVACQNQQVENSLHSQFKEVTDPYIQNVAIPLDDKELIDLLNAMETVVPETKAGVYHITDEQQITSFGNKVIALFFWAEWCGPCRFYNQIFYKTAEEYSEKDCCFGKINVDNSPELTMKFRINAIPATVIIKNQSIVNIVIGLIDETTLKSLIDNHIETKKK